MKAYYFTTGYGKVRIEAGSLHTALYRLGEWLEIRTRPSFSWKSNGNYNAHFVLDYIADPKGFITGYRKLSI